MDFSFSAAEEAFRQEVRAFLDEHYTEKVSEHANAGYANTPARIEFINKMAEKGWLAMGWPKEYGGLGERNAFLQHILNEELQALGNAPFTGRNVVTIGQTILRRGTERLKKEWLPRILKNEAQPALGYTEPDAGSDLASLKTTAVQDGDYYVINGQKRFITGAHQCDFFWLAVRTDPTALKHKGISLFLVDAKLPGITVQPMYTIAGERTNEVWFDNVRVHKDYLVGEANKGWYYISEALDLERFSIISFARVIWRFSEFARWVKTARFGDRRLKGDREVRRQVAQLACKVAAGRMLDYLCIAMAQKPEYVPNTEAAMNKVWVGEVYWDIDDAALDIMGPYGYLVDPSKHAPMEGAMARAYLADGHRRVGAGGVNVSKRIVARRYLKLPE